MPLLVIILLLLTPRSALHALTLVETFSSTAQFASGASTGVWNAGLGWLHVPLEIQATASQTLSIGDGSDGPFNSTTMYSFDVNGGAIANRVTLSTSRVYQFTTFILPTGVTLWGSGTTGLIIKVQGDVRIAGNINLVGGSGEAPTSSSTTASAGGTACCGGGDGGAGGVLGSNGTNGTPAIGGGEGLGGGGDSADAGGGGGGSYGTQSIDGDGDDGSTAGNGGAKGLTYGSLEFTDTNEFNGGSGGGGAGGSINTVPYKAGGGGGAGGGALFISSGQDITVTSTGKVMATGGDGGVPDGAFGDACSSGGEVPAEQLRSSPRERF